MNVFGILIAVLVFALILWAFNRFVQMDSAIKTIFNVIIVVMFLIFVFVRLVGPINI